MGDVRQLWIPGPAGRLEAAMRLASPARGAVVLAHPHPLHGGTLHQPVIFHADRELNRAGFGTLRFNFRGAGSSVGLHDDGRGEVDDVAAAVAWTRALAPGSPLILVGYSFGAWCGLRHAVRDPSVAAFVAIGLPVRTYGFEDWVDKLDRPMAAVHGERDELASPDDVRAVLGRSSRSPRLIVVPRADHLFRDLARQAADAVVDAVSPLDLRAPGR